MKRKLYHSTKLLGIKMEAILKTEQGGHGAWIAEPIHRHAQRGSASKWLHPLGQGSLGPQKFCQVVLLLAALMLSVDIAGASTLRPSVIVHGELRDAYGVRLYDGAQVSAFLGDQEVARTNVGQHPNNLSYRLLLDVHDPVTAASSQVTPHSSIHIRVKQGVTEEPLIGPTTFLAPGDGSSVRADFVFGEDTDEDGLPDAWEHIVIANSGGTATTLSDVGPGHDVDGDGMNDDQEFWYGSFAFLSGDELSVDDLEMVEGKYELTLFTVAGALYTVETTTSLVSPMWSTCPISMTPADSPAPVQFEGDGGYVTVYIEPSEKSLYRLKSTY